jgi:hypothetical protein
MLETDLFIVDRPLSNRSITYWGMWESYQSPCQYSPVAFEKTVILLGEFGHATGPKAPQVRLHDRLVRGGVP